MNVIIETGRLLLRTFSNDDAALLFELNSDPAVTVYTQDRMLDEEHAKKVLTEVIMPQYLLYGHGRWAVHTKVDMDFIGWCGLKFVAERNEIDLGYRFMKRSWGNGYATEAARASIDYGFQKVRMERIIGKALPANLASIRVLEKCGMTYAGEEDIDGLLHKTYQVINPAIKG